jgi:hydrogenase large subunit
MLSENPPAVTGADANRHSAGTGSDIHPRLLAEIAKRNGSEKNAGGNSLDRLGGSLAFYCAVNLQRRKILDAAAMATLFRGYESLLPGRELHQAGRVSSTASGICGGVHAAASALCLEMALDLKPPPLGILLRNLLLSCQYLNDNPMHLFILSGPDYSQATVQQTNPEIWKKAECARAKYKQWHGYRFIGDILTDLNKPDGRLYLNAMEMIRTARAAYSVLGGKYPHSESIVPGGVTISPTLAMLDEFMLKLAPFHDYAKQTIAIWDDVFDFMLEAEPRYGGLGKLPPNIIDFGQWDHEDHYDASYENCNRWGEKRWSTPGAVIDGRLVTTRLTDLNTGIEEFVDHSYYKPWTDHAIKTDPAGNPLSSNHPWNKRISPSINSTTAYEGYSWATGATWNRNVFEVGAYARMYLSALSRKLPLSRYFESTGKSLLLPLSPGKTPAMPAEWKVPALWNAFERNRARSYAIAFNLLVTVENCERAKKLLAGGERRVLTPLVEPPAGQRLGAGFWGAGRGFLAHWAVLNEGVIDNYQILVPSRINAGPRTPWGTPGACEQAILNTPIIESNFKNEAGFRGIDIQRTIQSFDPCMPCSAHIFIEDSGRVLDREVDTAFPL